MRAFWAIASKDLIVEARGKELLNSVAPFAGALLLVFGLAFGPGRPELRVTAPSILWLAVLLSGLLTVKRSFEVESDDGGLEGLMLSPAERGAVFLGKMAAVVAQIMLLGTLTLVGVVILFAIEEIRALPLVLGGLLLGSVGLSAIGVLFAGLSARARGRDSLLPLLVLPLVTPVVLAGIRSTQLAFEPDGAATPWLGLLAAFAAIFTAAGTLIFEHLMEE